MSTDDVAAAKNTKSALAAFATTGRCGDRVDYTLLGPCEAQNLPAYAKLEVLRELRLRPLRRPALVLACATGVLNGGGKGGMSETEYYEVTEQCAIAAIDCGQLDQAAICINSLKGKFGAKSTRIRKSEGLLLEAAGKKDAAKLLYAALAKELPGDPFVVKRQVAICKGEGAIEAAIDLLEKRPVYVDEDENPLTYLATHPLDQQAFKELVSLHLELGNTDRALYYIEECLLVDPFDYALHCRHGEIAHAAGFHHRAATAFSQSLRLNGGANNVRAAYGLYLSATAAIKAESHSSSSSRACDQVGASNDGSTTDPRALQAAAVVRLRQAYTASGSSHVLEMMIARQDGQQ